MRNMVYLLAVTCIVAPAFAGDITFFVNSSSDRQFTIGYSATEGPVGIGLKVTVTGDCDGTVSGGDNVVYSDPEFDLAIDYAHGIPDPNDYVIGPGGGFPPPDPCGPDPGYSVFSILMGRLDPSDPPPSVVNLVTIELDCHGQCTLTVSIEEDTLRGGIVGAPWGTVDATDSTSVVCPAATPPCPIPCWDFPTQCYGDTDSDGDVDTYDWPGFRDSFGSDYCDDTVPSVRPDYRPCVDYDRDGDVDTLDWQTLRDNFGSGDVPPDCPLGGTWPPQCP